MTAFAGENRGKAFQRSSLGLVSKGEAAKKLMLKLLKRRHGKDNFFRF